MAGIEKLTDRQVETTKFKDKPIKLSDGGGLFLLVTKGGKYWRYSYRFSGKQKTLAIGVHGKGNLTLKKARDKHKEARELVEDGKDPAMVRKVQKQASAEVANTTFELIAKEWLSRQTDWKESHRCKVVLRLEKDVYPVMGFRPITEITAPEILACLSTVEERGAVDSAHRIRQTMGAVFRFAISTGRATYNPIPDTKGALTKVSKGSYPAITKPKRVGELLRAIDGYEGHPTIRCALQLLPLVFTRPGELRAASWSEFDGDMWTIPKERMKAGQQHFVPLSRQTRAILDELHLLTGTGKLLFPSFRGEKNRPISDATLNAGLRRLSFLGDEMVCHGFRHMASTLLNEQQYDADLIEAALAHKDGSIRGKYNSAKYLKQRKQMMQHYADYLSTLKRGAQVVELSA